MSDMFGYQNFSGTGLNEEILASTKNLIKKSVTIDASCRDSQNTVTTDLRRGLLLFPDPDNDDKYTELDADAVTATLEQNAVVLAEPLDISGGVDLVATVYVACVVKPSKLIDDSGYTLTYFDPQKCQRIIIEGGSAIWETP